MQLAPKAGQSRELRPFRPPGEARRSRRRKRRRPDLRRTGSPRVFARVENPDADRNPMIPHRAHTLKKDRRFRRSPLCNQPDYFARRMPSVSVISRYFARFSRAR